MTNEHEQVRIKYEFTISVRSYGQYKSAVENLLTYLEGVNALVQYDGEEYIPWVATCTGEESTFVLWEPIPAYLEGEMLTKAEFTARWEAGTLPVGYGFYAKKNLISDRVVSIKSGIHLMLIPAGATHIFWIDKS